MKRQKLRFNYILRRYLKVRKRWQRLKALQTNVRRQGILEKQIEKLYAQLKSLAFSLDKPVALSALSAVMITFNVEAQNFEAPVTNPFGISPVTTAWGQVSAAFVDLDNDGDFDMMTGETYGAFSYYENIGSATNPSFAAEQILPFGLTSLGNYFARPDFADIDNDGDMDLFAGHYSGNIFYFENIGTASSPNFGSIQTNPYGIAPSGITFSDVALVDIDSDGDADIISGEGYGNFIYFENSGTTSTPDFTTPPVLNPFSLTVLPVSTFGSSLIFLM